MTSISIIRATLIAVGVAAWGGVPTPLTSPTSAMSADAAPFDVTGHWLGDATGTDGQVNALMADLTLIDAKTFGGTLEVEMDPPISCAATGRLKRNLKVKMRLQCDNGGRVKLRGLLTPDTVSIAGKYRVTNDRRHPHGTFTLTRPVT